MHLEFREVTKRYGRKRALEAVSLEVTPGQIVALLGLNGAGKSTLLRCAAGLVAPNSGDILYDGEPLRREDLATRRRFFFLPDVPVLFFDETVIRNLTIVLRLHEADGAGAEDRVLALLEEFAVLHLAQTKVGSLSRGELYKVALVALIAADPEIWLFDEPLASGMDPLGLTAFRRHAREAAQRGRTVIYSTQLLEIAERFSDRAVVLYGGRVRAFDTVERLSRAGAGGDESGLDDLLRGLREEKA